MAKIWRSIEEKEEQKRNPVSHANRKLSNGESLDNVLDDKTLNTNSSRRDFLKLFGFSVASAAVAASCEQPVRKAIPFLIRPENLSRVIFKRRNKHLNGRLSSDQRVFTII